MEASDFDNVYWVIFGSVVGFLVLAFALLYPVLRFINREEEASRAWTPDEIARAARRHSHGGDGGAGEAPPDEAPPRAPTPQSGSRSDSSTKR